MGKPIHPKNYKMTKTEASTMNYDGAIAHAKKCIASAKSAETYGKMAYRGLAKNSKG